LAQLKKRSRKSNLLPLCGIIKIFYGGIAFAKF